MPKLRLTLLVLALAAAGNTPAATVIRGATVIDGTGAAP